LGREALATLWALAATADLGAIFGRARVNDSGIIVSAKRTNHFGVSPFILLAFSLFRCKEGISKTTLKTLLMEVLVVMTPTSSGNYKALHEGLPVE
jgi:hypothetical protein